MGLHIDRVQTLSKSALLELLEDAPGLPLVHLPTFDASNAAKLQAGIILEKSAHNETALFAALEGDSLMGVLLLEATPWDSAQYGMAMGRIAALHTRAGSNMDISGQLLSAALRFSRNQAWRFVDYQPSAQDLAGLNAALSLGFRLVASTLALDWNLQNDIPAKPACEAQLRVATPGDADALAAMARQAIDPYSRFACDTQLAPEKVGDIFGAWAANSAKGYADRVYLAEADGALIGYCTWRIHRAAQQQFGYRHANLDLTAVAAKARGGHILSALMHTGLSWLQEEGFATAEVITHILNGPMQRAAHRFGATTRAARHNLHWHA